MKRSFYARYSLLILALFFVLAPLVVRSAIRALQHGSNPVADWLPEAFEATQKIHWFAEHFVSDDMLMISWEGCTLADERVSKLAGELRKLVSLPDQQPQAFVRKVITGSEVLDQLRDEPLSLSRRVALRRLQGWLVGGDAMALPSRREDLVGAPGRMATLRASTAVSVMSFSTVNYSLA